MGHKKLKTCVINKNKDFLISVISDASDRYGNKLIEFMDMYHLINLQEATVDQLQTYIIDHMNRPKAMEVDNGRNAEIGSTK